MVGPAGFSCGAPGGGGRGGRFAVSPSSVHIAASINMTPAAGVDELAAYATRPRRTCAEVRLKAKVASLAAASIAAPFLLAVRLAPSRH